jgi:hypothetical protein
MPAKAPAKAPAATWPTAIFLQTPAATPQNSSYRAASSSTTILPPRWGRSTWLSSRPTFLTPGPPAPPVTASLYTSLPARPSPKAAPQTRLTGTRPPVIPIPWPVRRITAARPWRLPLWRASWWPTPVGTPGWWNWSTPPLPAFSLLPPVCAPPWARGRPRHRGPGGGRADALLTGIPAGEYLR